MRTISCTSTNTKRDVDDLDIDVLWEEQAQVAKTEVDATAEQPNEAVAEACAKEIINLAAG